MSEAPGKPDGAGKRSRLSWIREHFHRFSVAAATATGTPWAFVLAVAVIIAWAISGPAFGFSDTWQLVINTGTTIITFLMVFLIQHTQNRDARAMQLKLDEMIYRTQGPRNMLIDLEDCTEEEIKELEEEFKRIRKRQKAQRPARAGIRQADNTHSAGS
jgi:low affinity Fe/Cu permease